MTSNKRIRSTRRDGRRPSPADSSIIAGGASAVASTPPGGSAAGDGSAPPADAGEHGVYWTPNADVLAGAEGQVNVVAWAGYVEDGSTDPAVDWVTPFEDITGCAVNVQARQHQRRDGAADAERRVRRRLGVGRRHERLIAGGEVVADQRRPSSRTTRDVFDGPQAAAVELGRRAAATASPTAAAPTCSCTTPRRSPTPPPTRGA